MKKWNRKIILAILTLTSAFHVNFAGAAPTTVSYTNGTRVTQNWNAGWDIQNAALNYSKSNVVWVYDNSTKTLKVSYYLSGATAAKQLAVGMSFYAATSSCPNPTLTTFGQYKVNWACGSATRDQFTATKQDMDIGVIQVDNNGNGQYDVEISGIAPGTYRIQYWVRQGVGCGFGNNTVCNMIFQSGGTYGSYYTVTVN